MDACRASSCCREAKNAPWMEVPVVPSEKVTRVVPVPILATVVVAGAVVPQATPGVPPRRWRSWISSPQRRLTRLNIPWTNEPLPHNTTNHSIFSTGFPRTGKFRSCFTHIMLKFEKILHQIYIYIFIFEKNKIFNYKKSKLPSSFLLNDYFFLMNQ